MQLSHIFILASLAVLFRLAPANARRWLVFLASIVCLYWLQPALPIRTLSFWLPTATLVIALLGWLLTTFQREEPEEGDLAVDHRSDATAGGLLLFMILVIGLTRYLGDGDWLLAAMPPPAGLLIPELALLGVLLAGAAFFLWRKGAPGWLLGLGIAILLLLLVVLKTPALSLETARLLRQVNGQNPALAAGLDVRWLGFSYIAFRLVHTLRDRQTGRLPVVELRDFISYVIFFPALVAGPIDRLERFARDFCDEVAPARSEKIRAKKNFQFEFISDPQIAEDLTEAGRRLVIGLLKKFVVADMLALVALNPTNAGQVQQAGWMWLLLYLYALQILFDFSGYTDIAIAIGRVIGVKLPENFAAPYLKSNLTQFWNSWHMSLTQWFRGYFFNPFVRWLRTQRIKVSPVIVLLLSQVATMALIGMWHGVTLNFLFWGLWHGLGLFVQNRWSEITRGWFASRSFPPLAGRVLSVFSTLFTFHFVAIGWVFFLLPSPNQALHVLKTLFTF